MNEYIFDTSFAIPNTQGCVINGINLHSEYVGLCLDYAGSVSSFAKLSKGVVIIAYPDAMLTFAQGIDDNSNVYGDYKDAQGITKGFMYHNGTYTTIVVPNATATYISNVNSNGVIVGIQDLVSGGRSGYILESNSTYSAVSVPNSVECGLHGIATNGDAVGYCVTNGIYKNSIVKPYNDSAIVLPPKEGTKATMAYGISSSRMEIVGQYFENDSTNLNYYNSDEPKGFLYKDSTYFDFKVPESRNTGPVCMNDIGVVVGYYDTYKGQRRAFIATPK